MTLKNSIYYTPYQILEKNGVSFADYARKKRYYNQLAFIFEAASSRSPHTRQEVNFLIKAAQKYSSQPKSFLDLACGTGRHARVLSRLGYELTGVDASPSLLAIARRKDKKTTYVGADMRRFNLKTTFDCVYCLWESYNYLSSPSDLSSFFGRCQQHLNPGGILILDSRNFFNRSLGESPQLSMRSFTTEGYDVELLIRKKTVLEDRVHEGIFIYFISHGRQSNVIIDQELVRIYSPQELKNIYQQTFKQQALFGDFDLDENYSAKTSKRMIIILKKGDFLKR